MSVFFDLRRTEKQILDHIFHEDKAEREKSDLRKTHHRNFILNSRYILLNKWFKKKIPEYYIGICSYN